MMFIKNLIIVTSSAVAECDVTASTEKYTFYLHILYINIGR